MEAGPRIKNKQKTVAGVDDVAFQVPDSDLPSSVPVIVLPSSVHGSRSSFIIIVLCIKLTSLNFLLLRFGLFGIH